MKDHCSKKIHMLSPLVFIVKCDQTDIPTGKKFAFLTVFHRKGT